MDKIQYIYLSASYYWLFYHKFTPFIFPIFYNIVNKVSNTQVIMWL